LTLSKHLEIQDKQSDNAYLTSLFKIVYDLNNDMQHTRLLLSVVIVSLIGVGTSMMVLTLSGFFDPQFSETLKMEKEYFFSYTISEPTVLSYRESKIIGHGETGFFELEGDIVIKYPSLSVQTPITVEIELYPKGDMSGFEPYAWNILPEDFFVFFPDAGYYDVNTRTTSFEKSVIIPLKKIENPPKIVGTATIMYQSENEYAIYILDPRELSDHSYKGEIELIYSLNEDIGVSSVMPEGNVNPTIKISSAGNMNDIISMRTDGFYYWLAFTLGSPAMVFAFSKFYLHFVTIPQKPIKTQKK